MSLASYSIIQIVKMFLSNSTLRFWIVIALRMLLKLIDSKSTVHCYIVMTLINNYKLDTQKDSLIRHPKLLVSSDGLESKIMISREVGLNNL